MSKATQSAWVKEAPHLVSLGMCAIDLRPAEERERLKSSLREWLRLERKRLPSDLSSPSGVELVPTESRKQRRPWGTRPMTKTK